MTSSDTHKGSCGMAFDIGYLSYPKRLHFPKRLRCMILSLEACKNEVQNAAQNRGLGKCSLILNFILSPRHTNIEIF